ncbi:hypothetical protein HCN44_005133 [Aphidius gifuensis]|uniref:Menorin-like domain-containing protein n=2 Tax=Aphidius gifuensis TaxID=684658 RepID=A0A835CQF0_APHGI|nr:hypothetical protein HCN44_005133 [Aphidius gifuensis]
MADEWDNPQVFFNKKSENITWAHAVNSQQKLQESLSNDAIMMLEADVSLIDGNDSTPMMAHSSKDKSDLSLEKFIETVIISNNKTKKGIKLDFKTIEAFNASHAVLQKQGPNMTFPVFLNADILKGHLNATKTPVDADAFLTSAVKILPKSILSIGWTTPDTMKGLKANESYTKENIDAMLEKIKMITSTQPITYPVRANLAVNSISVLSDLIEKSKNNNASLTIWTAKDDTFNKTLLDKLIKDIGSDKVYVDLPTDKPKSSAIRFGANTIGITLTLLLVINGLF